MKDTGNNTKVKIWVRNIANLPNVPSNALGLVTSFYTMPYNTNANFGGIIDNEVWKTITLGSDSFINVASPLTNTNGSQTSSGNFYHGMMAFNFNSVTWNTTLSSNATTGQYDLYTVVLHEVTHALGFASLMNANGQSVFGTGYNYFSRYDALLKNNAGTQKIITNTGACSLYNYSFNSSLSTSILNPNTSSCISDQTTCTTAIKFFGPTNTTSVYTPNCFEEGSSLSHFEDQCIAPPNQGNNTYFAMSNAVGTAVTKRFLKPEERNTLSDIGYRLNSTYGNNTAVFNSFMNYGGGITVGNTVAGTNDGIGSLGVFTFTGNTSTPINLTNLLTNDRNAASFECLQDVFDSTALIPTTSGITSTPITFSSTVDGLHLLRYVPVSASGQKGNISYIYVYLNTNNNCGVPSSCNLVINGDFEQHNGLPTSGSQLNGIVCGWNSAMVIQSNEYFHSSNSNTIPELGVPCNDLGFENDNEGGNAYVGMFVSNFRGYEYSETLRTKLSSPLLANTDYQLVFDVSLADYTYNAVSKFQAYLGELINYSGYGYMPIPNSNMLKTNPSYSITYNGWERIVFNFRTGNIAGEEYLYIGGLTSESGPFQTLPTWPYTSCLPGGIRSGTPYYYLDNVSLIPLNGGSFDLPTQVCTYMFLANLTHFLQAVPTNGIFTGNGVSLNSGVYVFDPSSVSLGNHTITYTYTNSNGCQVSISDTIQVVNNNIVPQFNAIAPICSGGSIMLPTTSVNFINGTWSPTINNTATTTYTFTPSGSQCGAVTTTLTVEVLAANDPSCNSNPCPASLTLSTIENNSTIIYKTANWIEANNGYVVDNKNVTMKAGDFIAFKPDAHLKAGSEVTAKIETCTPTSRIAVTKEVEKIEEQIVSQLISLFPNPTTDRLTIASENTAMNSVIITAMDGKIIYSNYSVNSATLELDTSSYQGGIYMVSITTINGTGFVKKLIKN